MLKKVSLFFVALVCAFAVHAQDQTFKKFRVGLSTGYAAPGGSGAKGGVLFNIEPAYRIQDKILVGLRWEAAVMLRGYDSEVGDISASASASASTSLYGQYYLSNNTFRPYVGLGIGSFSVASVTVDASDSGGDVYPALDESKIGFFPKVGFDLGHFSMGIDYNLIGKSTVTSQTNPNNSISTKNSYLGVHLGFFFGGGRK